MFTNVIAGILSQQEQAPPTPTTFAVELRDFDSYDLFGTQYYEPDSNVSIDIYDEFGQRGYQFVAWPNGVVYKSTNNPVNYTEIDEYAVEFLMPFEDVVAYIHQGW